MGTQMASRETTRALIARARKGDRRAFDDLAEEHRERLLAFIRTRLGAQLRRRTEPDDILQEAYLKGFRSLDRFEWRGEGSFFGWLATIAEYVIRELGRSHKLEALPLEREPLDEAPSPSRVARREERFVKLGDALSGLSEDHRTVIRLARIEGLAVTEIARRMERSPGAVRHLLLRALQKLRERFGDETQSLGLPPRRLEKEEGLQDGD